jgi:hypothetical protein
MHVIADLPYTSLAISELCQGSSLLYLYRVLNIYMYICYTDLRSRPRSAYCHGKE